MADKRLTQEEIERQFKESLDDVVALAERLGQFSESLPDFIEMLKLAQSNNAQLRVLMAIIDVTGGSK